MKKFVTIYRVPVEVMEKWRKETSPEEMKAQGEKLGASMMAWMKKYDKSIVDKGLPLGKNTRLDSTGTAKAMTNDLNFYCVIEAESVEDVVKILNDSDTQIPGGFIDIMEVPHMGM